MLATFFSWYQSDHQVDGVEEEESLATLRRKVVELEAALAHNHRGGREVEIVKIMTDSERRSRTRICNQIQCFSEHLRLVFDRLILMMMKQSLQVQ